MNTRGEVFQEKLEKIKDKIYTFSYIFKLKKNIQDYSKVNFIKMDSRLAWVVDGDGPSFGPEAGDALNFGPTGGWGFLT